MIQTTSRLTKALKRAEQITSIPIEVLLFSRTTKEKLEKKLEELSERKILYSREIVVGVDPVHRHVALYLQPEMVNALNQEDIQIWLKELQEDLHMTYFENALALAILSLAISLSKKFPVVEGPSVRLEEDRHQR